MKKLLVILTIFISACSNSTNMNLKGKTNSINIYYHEDLLQNKVKIYLPMTEKKLRLSGQSKVVQSNLLYIKLNRIIDSNCNGGAPSSPIFIIAETSLGSVAIEQSKIVSVDGKKCNLSNNDINQLIRLMEFNKIVFLPE